MGAWSAERGMVALSRGTVLVSGSGVLVVGDVGTGFCVTRGFLYKSHTHRERERERDRVLTSGDFCFSFFQKQH